MKKPLDPMSVEGSETPSAAYVLRRRYGPARHVIMAVNWLTVFSMLLQPVAVLAADLTWDPAGGGGAGSDGAGTWIGNSWTDLTNQQTWNSTTPDNALIGSSGAGGTITLGTVTAGSITFNTFTGTYTFSGGRSTTD